MTLHKKKTNRHLKALAKLGTILLLGQTIVALAILAIFGNETGPRIMESTPVAITFLAGIGSGLLLLIYVAIKKFQASYRGEDDN